MAIDNLILSVDTCKPRHILYHYHVGPFMFLYTSYLISWQLWYGEEEYWFAFALGLAVLCLVQILLALFCYWFTSFSFLMSCDRQKDIHLASHVLVKPTINHGWTELVPLRRTLLKDKQIKIWFDFQKVIYIHDSDKKTFQMLTFDNNYPMEYFNAWIGLTTDEIVKDTMLKYGDNKMEMVIPSFTELFIERATAPFFVFQVFCVGLWCLEDLWYYSLFTLAMLACFEMLIVKQQMTNMTQIRNMGNKPHDIDVYRNKKWIKLKSNQLIVGDLISIGRSSEDNNIPADLLLLRGSCIVDESMLTGESVPQMKESVQNLEKQRYLNIESDTKLHILCGGTKIVQHTPLLVKNDTLPKSPDGGCLCYVLQTGFSTSQGSLLRTILFGVKRVTANNLETFGFISFLLVFAIAAAWHLWETRSKDPEFNKFQTLVECSLIITSVVPPELPLELSLAVNNSLVALHKLGIFCTEPFRIPFAGKIDICCFDKTGTLTSDSLVVDGIADISKDGKTNDADNLLTVDNIRVETLRVLAACHSLARFGEDIVGDPLEKATLKWLDYTVSKSDLCAPIVGKVPGMKILQRFHFSSLLKRMTTVAVYSPQGQEPQLITAVKGAPEVLMNMFTNIPEDYENGYKALAQAGYRVLALGYSELGNLEKHVIKDLSRDDLERNLLFAGFLVISCPLKKDTKAMIKEIKESGHTVVMITGDNPLTACHVAKELKFTADGRQILVLENEKDTWVWKSVDETITKPLKPKDNSFFNLNELCVTGSGLAFLHEQEKPFLRQIIKHIKIFARTSPKQKELIIHELKHLGFITLMCGDGTNDVGALKHSHVGVALLSHPFDATKTKDGLPPPPKPVPVKPPQIPDFLLKRLPADHPYHNKMSEQNKKVQKMMDDLNAEEVQIVKLGDASIAAPFTSKFTSIASICSIIKQGRCTLVVTLQMFKILALNALVSAYSQSVLYSAGIRSSDYQQTLQGLLLASCFLFITRSKPLNTLSKQRPIPNIFNVYTLLTVTCQFIIHFYCLIQVLDLANFYDPQAEVITPDTKFKPSLLNSAVYLLSMTLQISTFVVNYRGRPFMESLWENKPLLYSAGSATAVVFMLASNSFQSMATQFELVEFPDQFRNLFVAILFGDIAGCYLVDSVLNYLLGDARP
uniref:Cation-transporting ATPase n=1 Tax=Rhabditophanes sp. KR3021 TaxID=114890 RepID=A0AC35TYK2_9BILA